MVQAAASQAPSAAAAPAADQTSLLDSIVAQSKVARSDEERSSAKNAIAELVREVMKGTVVMSDNLAVTLDARIAELDRLLSAQVSEVMHHKDFQRLESSWRGLHYLCKHTGTGPAMKIRVLNATKKELVRDFETQVDFDQSALFKKVYEEEYGMFGGSPYAALIGDFEISRQGEDMNFVQQMSHIAAAAHAPFLTAASAEMFGLDSFTDLNASVDLARGFEGPEYVKWRSFRQSDDARYVGVTVPHFLGRLPYDPKEGTTVEGFNFVEEVDGSDHNRYLWVNAAYALGARLAAAFEDHGWCAAIRGVKGGGLVEDLPTHTFKTVDGEVALKCPTEVAIPDRRDKELSDLGFISLVHCKDTDYAAFFAVQSAQKPAKWDTDAANANARLSAQLPYMFAVCRIAHYLKAMMRDQIGSFASSATQVSNHLNDWIKQYVTTDDNATQDQKAAFPLREARVEVTPDPARPGAYRAVAFIRPHFQLDELTVSLRLVAELPQGKG